MNPLSPGVKLLRGVSGDVMECKLIGATRTGRNHLLEGCSCQDSICIYRGDDTVCVDLADGAGSRERSGEGAGCVTNYVSHLLCERFENLWELDDKELSERIIEGCLGALSVLEGELCDKACTLLFFAANQSGRFLSGHLGDGVQILVHEDGSMDVFSPPENGMHQNETFFITEYGAIDHLRLKKGMLAVPGVILLMSDGVAESLYQRDTGTPAAACRTIAGWMINGDEETAQWALEMNLEKIFSRHSWDDLGLAAVVWGIDGIKKENLP